MELKWLEDFVMLSSTASFSRAAEARHVTQSAFSRRIKQLEAWLGVTLVNRASIPAELTLEGKTFLPAAQEMIRTFYATRTALNPDDERQGNAVSLAALHTLVMTFLPDWLARMHTALPGLYTSVVPDRGGIEANLETLVEKEADVFLTYAHPYVPLLLDPEQFDWLVLGAERVLPVAAPQVCAQFAGPLREGASLLEQAIATGHPLPYLDYGHASFFGTALHKVFFDNPPFKRRILHRNAISAGLRELALRGWGMCWQPESLVADDLAAGRLVHAGGESRDWEIKVDIRLYRHRGAARPIVHKLWETAASLHPRATALT